MKIKLLIIDVDGTMTDGGVYYDEHGNETKKFCTKDAAGFFAAYEAGIKIMVLTGRHCAATERRMNELKVNYLEQGIKDKLGFIRDFVKKENIQLQDVGYIGDDLNDLSSMRIVGYKACPNDSCSEIKAICDYISPMKGGYGAVREIIEHYLTENNLWKTAIEKIYSCGI